MLDQVRPIVDVGYENVVATMNGELKVEGVTIRFPRFDDSLTVESVNVLTPGFLFLLGFDDDARALEFPERLGVEFEGLRASVDADFMRTLEDYRAMQAGAIELTPTDVCASTYGFTPSSLKRFGYHEVAVDFRASFRRLADELVVDVSAIAAQLCEVQTLARGNGMELDELIMQPVKPVDLTRLRLYKPSDVPNLLNLVAEAG